MDCKDCIFTEWNKKVQTGCAANRLSKFIEMDKVELKTEDSTFYELKQFCNLYRPEDWKENKDADNLLNIALKQIKPRFGIVVHDSQEQDTNLNDTLESIKNINYDKSLIRIVISSFKNRGVQYLISKVVEMQNENFDCVMSMHLYSENEQLRDYECFSKLYKNSYFVKIPQGLKISPNLFSQIELSLNTKLEQIAFFEDQDENISAVPYGVVNNEYLNYNSYNKMLKGIKDVAKKNNKYIKYEN